MTKNILIIGNGFDIEHGLPTKYSDFLDFIDNLESSVVYRLLISEKRCLISNIFIDGVRKQLINSGQLHSIHKYICDVLGSENHIINFIKVRLLEHNTMVKGYGNNCKEVHERYKFVQANDSNQVDKFFKDEKRESKNRWVDFEQEIAQIIRYAESKLYGEDTDAETEAGFVSLLLDFDHYSNDSEVLRDDFYRLLCGFEIYVTEIVNRIEVLCFSEDIKNITPDVVISFNYSDTYERIYGRFGEIDYIHGKADLCLVDNQYSKESITSENTFKG